MMREMSVDGSGDPSAEEVVVLMGNENPKPPSRPQSPQIPQSPMRGHNQQNPQAATLIPKYDIKKTRKSSVYSHSDMTQRLSTTEVDETRLSHSAGGGGGGGGGGERTTTMQRIKDFKEQLDNMMSQRGCYISNLIALLLPLLLLIFGSVFLRRCQIQPKIPIYLIVAGVFSLLEILFRIFRNLAHQSKFIEAFMEGQNKKSLIPRIINFIFLAIWFFIGSGWVYGIYYPTAEECNHALYNFAFWFITLTYVCTALSIIAGIALVIYANKCVLK